MHVLERNKECLWYANPTSVEYATDLNGYKTGERKITYSAPVKVKMSMAISSGANNLGSQGMAELERFGIFTGYTHRAVTDDMSCPMNEESLVWYKINPTSTVTNTVTRTVTESVDGEEVERQVTEEVTTEVPVPHNFKIVRKAVSLNHLIYYLKEVDVN